MNPIFTKNARSRIVHSCPSFISSYWWRYSGLLFFLLFTHLIQAQDCIVFEPLPDREIECSETLIFEEPVATNTCCDTEIFLIFEDEITESDCQKTIKRTWHAASDCGGGSISQTVTIFDETPPVVTINDPLVAGLNSGDTLVFNCDELELVNPNSITVTDACDPEPMVMFQEFNINGNCPEDGFIRLMDCAWIVKDRCDNRDTFKIFFKITDLEPPVITFCPPDVDLECVPASEALPHLTGGSATAEDACGDVIITYMDDLQGNNCTGTIIRTWKAEDICGNVRTCTQTITVRDDPPMITCPADVIINCSDSTQPNQTGMATATDECGGINISHEDEETGADCERVIRRTWTAEDNCGNQVTCLQIIRLIDNEAPVITCPADVILECVDGFEPSSTGMATATDDCNDVDISHSDEIQSGSDDCERTIIRTWTATDACGNMVSCEQNIKLIDSTAPEIICPADIDLDCTDSSEPSSTGMATATDDCNEVTMSHSDEMSGDDCETIIIRMWTAEDACGNVSTCTQTIRLIDNTTPEIICPPNVDIDCTEDLDLLDLGMAMATDDCNEVTITHVDMMNGDDCEATLTRAWTAEDACNNASTCIQTIQIIDNTAPEITCPDDIELDCTDGFEPSSTGMATATDDCNDVTISHSDEMSGDDCETTIIRTWTAEDACGNVSTCTQTIRLIDNEAPVITCPEDMILECVDGFEPSSTGMATATDDCNDVDISHSDETQSGSDDCERTIIRTWTATDACGNMVSCEQTIKLIDTTAPEITCPDDIDLDCTDSSEPSSTGMAMATDACNEVTMSHSDETSGDDCETIIIRTWTAEDACGNVSTCIQTIRLIDDTAPEIICPADIDLDCTDSFEPSSTGMATATDDCNEVTMSHSDETSGDDCEMIIIRTWTAEDACGNASTCTQTIRLIDDTAPEITCPDDIDLDCTDSFEPSSTGMATAMDDCNDVDISHSDETQSGSDDCETIIIRTWTAEDACGNVSTCTQTIRLIDNTAPVLTCPEDMILECVDGFEPSSTGMTTATDDCNDVDISHSDETQSGSDDCERTIIRTWTATDACGNMVSCEQTIKLIDTTAPEITCPDDIDLDCTDSSEPSSTGMATATDACNEVTMSHSDETSGDDCETIIIRTWTAEDACGNVSTCTQTIRLIDDTAPEIICPADIDLDCTDSFEPSSTGMATATDDCNEVTMSHSDETSGDDCEMIIIRTWTAEDACGNASTCTQTIRLIDDTAPEITCPDDIDLDCTDSFEPSSTGMATAMDDCNDVDISHSDETQSGSDDCETIIIRTWTAEDACGNVSTCTQTIRLIDNTAPVLTCPEDMILECVDGFEPSSTGMATATDDCNDVDISHSDETQSGSDDCERTIIRTWTATDACGNMVSCEQTIKLIDTTAPEITCPDDIDLDCTDSSEPSSTGMATATDACNDITMSHSDETSGDDCETIIIRTWTAEDACGNVSTCTQTIRLIDNTAPEITCPADIDLDCTDSFEPSSTGMATATDDCNEVTMSHSDEISGDDCEMTIIRTWTAEDACGNVSTCTQTIRLIDDTAPEITCPGDMEMNCTEGFEPSSTGMATATDDCNEVTINHSDETTGDDCNLIIVRTWTAEDACGNVSTCEQIIKLIDNEAPVITCPDDVILECVDGFEPSSTGMATAMDDCNDVDISHSDETQSGSDDCERTIIRTWTATDACGNTVSCEQTIKLIDTTAPEITCPDDIDLDCTDSSEPSSTGMATATDACNDITMSHSDETSGDDCETIIIRTWTAEDACGNVSTCTQTIRLIDNTAPEITCPADIDLDCTDSFEPSSTGMATATDDCNEVTVSHSDEVSGDDCETLISRTWTAEDACGNVSTCTQTIRLIDNTAPEITCPEDMILDCLATEIEPSETGMATATDDCNEVSISHSDDVFNDACGQTITRTWTAEDACGNVSTCIQLIKLIDNNPPEITCPEDAVNIQCDDSIDPSIVGEATATDDCSNVTITFTDDDFASNACEQIIVRTWTAEDVCGNIVTCDQTIKVLDNTAPEITCPDDVVLDCNGNSEPSETGMATAIDNCSEFTITHNDVTQGSGCSIVLIRTWRAEDACGNVSTCEQRIEFTDNTAPEITCPSDVDLDCTDGFEPSSTGMAAATDDCNDVTIDFEDDTNTNDCETIITRTWTAEDACGNVSTCEQIITLIDNTAPVITCPADAIVDCDGSSNTGDTGEATATDDCGEVTITHNDETSGSDCELTITRTWTAEDACGNVSTCEQIIQLIDSTAPEITCPADITIECGDSIDPSATGEPTANDNCGAISSTHSDAESGDDCFRFITRIWSIEDACGNVSTCEQLIRIEDTTAPEIVCPADIDLNCTDISDLDNIDTGTATGTDACNEVMIEKFDEISGDDCERVITRTWQARDVCGNTASCEQIIRLIDNTAPEITCPVDVDLECGASTDPLMTGEATATDDCNVVAITHADETTTDDCETIITRTWTAEDACGNSTTCEQVIRLIDNTAPQITCPDDIIIECGESLDPSNTGTPIISDNCSEVDFTFEDEVIEETCEQLITRTFKVTDACGNIVTCIQIIKVQDTTAPTITFDHPALDGVQDGDIVTFECDDVVIFTENDAQVEDDCSNTTVVFSEEGSAGECTEDGYFIQLICTWTAEDVCGNVDSIHIIVRIVDTQAPTIMGVPDDVMVDCEDIPDIPQVTTSDNCEGEIDLFFEESHVENDTACMVIRRWTATDQCGNATVESYRIIRLNCVECTNPFFSEFISFDAEILSGEDVRLNWVFTPLSMTHRFMVERSSDNDDFDIIGSVDGIHHNGQNTYAYSFIDLSPRKANNFYRIRCVDASGQITTSTVHQRLLDGDKKAILVYPNPTRGDIWAEFVNMENEENLEYELVNPYGYVLQRGSISTKDYGKQISLDNLVPGVYILHFRYSRNQVRSFKVIKSE